MPRLLWPGCNPWQDTRTARSGAIAKATLALAATESGLTVTPSTTDELFRPARTRSFVCCGRGLRAPGDHDAHDIVRSLGPRVPRL